MSATLPRDRLVRLGRASCVRRAPVLVQIALVLLQIAPVAALIALVAALAAATPSLAQLPPFSVRSDAEGAANGPAGDAGSSAPASPASPSWRDVPAAPPPPPPSTAAVRSLLEAPDARAPGVRPFDVNGDGASPSTVLPLDEPEYFPSVSTTVSPLGGGSVAGQAVPADANNAEQRQELNRILRREVGEVRELRVNIDASQDWVEAIVDRPITPHRTLRLDGEIDHRSWSVFLSAAEAARGGTLSVAFTNSVLVLPEASRLRIFLNGRQIAQTAIDSPDRTKVVALPISPDLLRAGENAFRIEADMRHRIDCSISATYELWTRIDTRLTGFSFGGARIPVAGLADITSVGVGTNGATRLRVIQPQPGSSGSIDRMLRAVQSAALRGRYVQPLVEVVSSIDGVLAQPGVLNIAIGTFDAVRRVAPNLPASAASVATVDLIDAPAIGPTVIITGPAERDVDAALARFAAPEPSGQTASIVAATPPWLVRDSARIDGSGTVTLGQAGVDTINFSGRRFRRAFNVTLPPDFYAAAYGEATMLLDAAYSRDVRPGSRLSVFVNGTLSTGISFTSPSGYLYDDFPVALGMQAFRPGINTVELVAELETEADQACLPGGTVPAGERFALLSSTRLVFPNFARIGQLPNLASFATNGFPYQSGAQPVRVRIGGTSPDTIGAAGTLMARIAVSRGAALATNVVDQVGPFADAGLIVVAPLSDVDSEALDATGAADVIPATWLAPNQAATDRGVAPEGLERYDDVLRRLRQQLQREDVQPPADGSDAARNPPLANLPLDQRSETERTRDRWVEEVEENGGLAGFFSRTVRRLGEALNVGGLTGIATSPERAAAPTVPDGTTLLMAQAAAPASSTTAWTLVTAPSAGLLSTSMAALSAPEIWTRIGGRITAYELNDNRVTTVAVEEVGYLATVPLSFSNLRLIVANWFSINNGIYALGLLGAAMFLGIMTWVLVRPLGRQN